MTDGARGEGERGVKRPTSEEAGTHHDEDEADEADGADDAEQNLEGDEEEIAAEAERAPDKTLVSIRVAVGLAFVTGILYFAAFPGIDIWPLAFVALVPLIVALRGRTPRQGLALGWVAGFTMTMTGFYWLLPLLRVFSGFGTAICMGFMALLCAYQAGRIALCGWLYARAERRGWPAAPAFALAFVASELVFPLLFPWYYAATVNKAPPLLQLADLGGPYLVGLMLVAANLGIAEALIARREGRPVHRAILAVGIAAPLCALLYGYPRLLLVDRAARSAPDLKVGIIQANQPLVGKSSALQTHMGLTDELRQKGVDLVIWSEGGSGLAFRDDPLLRQMVTSRLGVPTIVGTLMARGEGKGLEFFNTALITDAKGSIEGRYDKQYLLAFGEYMPFGRTFPILYQFSPQSGELTPGTSIEPLPLGDHRISALICYEDILPGFVNRIVAHADPDLLVNLTNDTWFGNSTEPWIHLALAQLRAVEHRRYLVRATNSGVSAIVDPVGRVILHGNMFKEETLIGVVKMMRQKTVYEVVQDVPWWIATALIVAMGFVRRERVAALLKTSPAA